MKTIVQKIKIVFLSVLLSLGMNSCQDWLTVFPEGELILEDFWKEGSHVESVVGSCYRSLIEPACIERMIVWGEARSDNMVAGPDTKKDLSDILDVNIVTTNSYADWSSFYTVINYCNTVLFYAPGVVEIDNTYTINQMNTHRAEALSIRALCYFYLVRAFRDVPYVTHPSVDGAEDFTMPKTEGHLILDSLIQDLKEAKMYAQSMYGATNIRHNKGRFTKQSIRALLADIYLWQGRYQECVNECQEFLRENAALPVANQLRLLNADFMYSEVFVRGNSTESILELQFSDDAIRNTAVDNLYGGAMGGSAGSLTAPLTSMDYTPGSMSSPYRATDVRGINFIRGGGANGYLFINKYVGNAPVQQGNIISYGIRGSTSNFILYRLSDIYLMQAEALNELGEENLEQVLSLVNQTYMRSNPSLSDSLSIINYNDVESMRELVLLERQREFMFEGKRWFDLVRMVNKGEPIFKLTNKVSQKFSMEAGAFILAVSKMSKIDALYFPILQDEILANDKLVQNPFYQLEETSAKN
ncbi:MAG: RagB/SusD family nutrient uptake outer membrane protein [Bacteroidales bacterium]|nr:RagB/SusD family nutrient uptake outer membrane protein [Bacteroidales bacterium]MDD4641047.1 RagB/SusD family nutrient uptake outer membrane protein [Bacteroidales bacterium]